MAETTSQATDLAALRAELRRASIIPAESPRPPAAGGGVVVAYRRFGVAVRAEFDPAGAKVRTTTSPHWAFAAASE